MAKFNLKSIFQKQETNLAGGRAFGESPELEFASLVLTSFVEDQFYRKQSDGCFEASDTLQRVSDLLDSGMRHEFAAKAAVYARERFNMRSISHVVAAELAARVKNSDWMRPFVRNAIVRIDDMTEIVAYFESKYGRKPVPNALKRGIRDAFDKFDGYQLAKYRGENRAVKLVDVVNLVHPVPNDRNGDALKQLVRGTLRSTETWESKLTQVGQKAESDEDKAEKKAEAWAEMVQPHSTGSGQAGKIGYMALVRNLRNIIQDAPEVVGAAAEMLVQPELVRKSRLLPFRFATARDELEKVDNAGPAIKALNTAADLALANVPRLEGKTLVVVDESSSMTWSNKGSRSPIKIASLFAAVVLKANPDAELLMFSNDARYVSVNTDDTLLTIQKQIEDKSRADGTNFHSVFKGAKKAYDRMVILSDMQGWMADGYGNGGAPTRAFAEYRKRTGADTKVYSFDLQGYGKLMFPERNVYALAGFSEKVFDVMALLDQDRNALVREIEAVQLT